MTEIWKSVPDYENKYEVSNFGRVRNEKGSVLKPFATHGGYFMVALHKKSVKTNVRLHRLVAQMFVPNPQNKEEVNHKNGIKSDNNATNLEWCSRSENMTHAYINGFQTKGAYPVRKVICLEDNMVYETIGEAARAYNIHRETVRSSCVRLCKGRKRTFRYFDERREDDERFVD